MYLLLVKLSMVFNAPVNNGDEGKFVGGWFGDKLEKTTDWFGESFRKALIDFGKWLINGLFNILSPFVIWGCRIIILWCIVTMFCTKDTKTLAAGFKAFLFYLVFLMIRSVII